MAGPIDRDSDDFAVNDSFIRHRSQSLCNGGRERREAVHAPRADPRGSHPKLCTVSRRNLVRHDDLLETAVLARPSVSSPSPSRPDAPAESRS